MKCTNCGTENTAGIYCYACGEKLKKLCPNPTCQKPVVEGARFCSYCGQNLLGETRAPSTMNDNVISGDVDQSVHTNITNTANHSVHASVVHIHQNEADSATTDLRCHECGEFIPMAQRYASQCYECGKHFCDKHLSGNLCLTCKSEQQLKMFEFVRQPNQKYIITKLKNPDTLQVTIPPVVDSIGDKAFMNTSVMDVTLSEGLLKIGSMAFANCADLCQINFPSSLRKIDDQSFLNCASLYVEPPANVRLGKDVFAGTLYTNQQERARRAEEQRIAEEARLEEEVRIAEELRKEEEARLAEATRPKKYKRDRAQIFGTAQRPRLAVYRTNSHISAQIINDIKGETITTASTYGCYYNGNGGNKTAAKAIGKMIAKKAMAWGITEVVFDSRGLQYHGRIAALADGAREGGLKVVQPTL